MRFSILSRRRAHRPTRVFNMREASITVNNLAINQTPLVHSTSSFTHAHHGGLERLAGRSALAPVGRRLSARARHIDKRCAAKLHTDRKGMGTQVCFTDSAPPNYQ